MKLVDMDSQTLWELRDEIYLGSIFYRDYENSFGIDVKICCDFFDGYLDYLFELMTEDNINSNLLWDTIVEYDSEEQLYNWLCMCFA